MTVKTPFGGLALILMILVVGQKGLCENHRASAGASSEGGGRRSTDYPTTPKFEKATAQNRSFGIKIDFGGGKSGMCGATLLPNCFIALAAHCAENPEDAGLKVPNVESILTGASGKNKMVPNG